MSFTLESRIWYKSGISRLINKQIDHSINFYEICRLVNRSIGQSIINQSKPINENNFSFFRILRYLRQSMFLRFVAVTGFFISIPVFLLGTFQSISFSFLKVPQGKGFLNYWAELNKLFRSCLFLQKLF